MTAEEAKACHERWAKALPERPWNMPEGAKLREQYENGQQCGLCRFYVALDGNLGMDWGVCANQASFYDGKVVFEHHTCPFFKVEYRERKRD